MPEKVDLSIIIVTWNSEEEIAECLRSVSDRISKDGDMVFEIIIVDNNSSDNTYRILEKYKSYFNENIKLIRNSDNVGFTKACNQGIELAKGQNILLLNPDTEIFDDALSKLFHYLNSDEKIGAVAPQLLYENMTIQYSCRTLPQYRDMFFELKLLSALFPRSKFFARWKMRYFSHNELSEVEQPMAAALMVKKNVLAEIGNMDERFVMFFNDVDLCKQILDRGYKIVFYSEAKVIHKKGSSVYQDRARMIKLWNEDCLSYFKKHDYNSVLYPLLSLGLKLSGFFRIIFVKIRRR